MFFRPATPLSVLYLVAFVLLLLSTLSTPVIKAIPLASYNGVNYGVFGSCKGSDCTGFKVGYTTASDDFTLSSGTRHSLSSILVVHPIAALLTLVCFGLSFAAHFHAPSHSPRFLLALLILSFPTLLITLLAFLVDILLFVPHLAWGGWIVLAATILIIASGVVTCAMRRTLVSRKARKKRIAENADMNGENFYANQHQERLATDDMHDRLPRAESPPPMSMDSTVGDAHRVPQFATFESSDRKSMDDRTPLNPRDPSIRSQSTNGAGRRPMPGFDNDAPPIPGRADQIVDARAPARDQYGNLLAPGAVALAHDLPPPGMRRRGSNGTLNSQGSHASDGSRGSHRSRGDPAMAGRGRGGYPPRGGYAPRGGYGPPRGGYGQSPRGSYGPAPRGGYGPRSAYVQRGGPLGPGSYRGTPQGMQGQGRPPPGWNGAPQEQRGMAPGTGAMAAGAGAGAAAGAMMGRERTGPPPGYDINDYYDNGNRMPPPGPMPFAASARTGSPSRRNPSPGPTRSQIGQAIEMDERTGDSPANVGGQYNTRDDDRSAPGLVGLQQGRPMQSRNASGNSSRNVSGNSNPMSPATASSIYSDQPYVAPRAAWSAPSPLSQQEGATGPSDQNHVLSPILASPPASSHQRVPSGPYYEDVDPRFATESDAAANAPARGPQSTISALPNSLQPGGSLGNRQPSLQHPHLSNPNATSPPPLERDRPIERDSSYENIAEGARSPAGSDASHFTSVSQRGVNPNWRPPPPGYGPGGPGGASHLGQSSNLGPAGGAPQSSRRNEMILGANPDFALPGMMPVSRARGGGGGPGAMGMGVMRGRGGGGMSRGGPVGLTPPGRYPTEL